LFWQRNLLRFSLEVGAPAFFGVRRQSEASTALWFQVQAAVVGANIQSGVSR
jgi:hypothetical protein